MILLCGECKQWTAETIRRIGHSRCGKCAVDGTRRRRVHICGIFLDTAAVNKNKSPVNEPRKLPDPQISRMCEAATLRYLGFTNSEIAQKMGIHQRTVTKYISKYNTLQKEAHHGMV